ncbi:MAG: hypothetical protein ACI81L_000643 [Verrucomicrobiales bacterium]
MPDPGRTEFVPDGMGKWSRITAVVFILAVVAFWIFAFSPWARDIFVAPDQIQDEVYVAAIETRCADALAEMDALPSIRSATGPENRADNLEKANDALQRMRTDLATLDGGTVEDRELIIRWLDDWDFYLEDRDGHVDRLRTEGDVRFLNTERDGIFIAERMSGFARVNEIRSCLPPGDL